MTDGSVTARIILEDDFEFDSGVIDGDVTEFTGLKQLRRPHNNGVGLYKERLVLVYPDDSVETVVGHLVGSEVCDR